MITACEKLADTLKQVECPMCDSGSVHVFLWDGALRIERNGLYTVKIPDGEYRDIDCLCRDCGCEWGEVAYPVGSEVLNFDFKRFLSSSSRVESCRITVSPLVSMLEV